MKRIFLAFAFVFAFLLGSAQDKSITPAVVCGPYVQNVTTSGFTVMWISDIDAMAWVEIAPDDPNSFYYSERPKYYDLSGCGVKPVNRIHKIMVDGLKPGTAYRYRIMMKAIEAYHGQTDITYGREYGADVYGAKPPVVKTLETSYKEVSFAVVNDIHAQDSVFRRLFADTKKDKSFDFILFNGDMTSDLYSTDKIVKHYLGPACDLFAKETPFYMARGNHEYRGKEAIGLLDYFAFPDRKPYYTFKYGKFFFIVMDSGEDKPDSDIEYQEVLCTDQYLEQEAEWLKEVTASEDFRKAERRIVFSHIPPQTEDAWHGNLNMSKLFLPILNKAGIDLMLCGHVHEYSFRDVGSTDAKFPVVVNACLERLEATLTAKKITISIFDADGRLTHSLDL